MNSQAESIPVTPALPRQQERSQTAPLGLSHPPPFSPFCGVAVMFVVPRAWWGCASDVVYSAVVLLTDQLLEFLPATCCSSTPALSAVAVPKAAPAVPGAAVGLHMVPVTQVLTGGSVWPPCLPCWSQEHCWHCRTISDVKAFLPCLQLPP